MIEPSSIMSVVDRYMALSESDNILFADKVVEMLYNSSLHLDVSNVSFDWIEQRMRDEQRKHPDSDWIRLASVKIGNSLSHLGVGVVKVDEVFSSDSTAVTKCGGVDSTLLGTRATHADTEHSLGCDNSDFPNDELKSFDKNMVRDVINKVFPDNKTVSFPCGQIPKEKLLKELGL